MVAFGLPEPPLHAQEGIGLFKLGIPLCEGIRGLILLKRTIWLYMMYEMPLDTVIELNELRELNDRMSLFFDRAEYYFIRGFMEEMSRELFDDLVGSQSFSLREVDFAAVESLDELVAIFIEFEKDTVLFYEMIAPFVEDGATRVHLQTIIAEENRHIARLKDFNPKRLKGTLAVR